MNYREVSPHTARWLLTLRKLGIIRPKPRRAANWDRVREDGTWETTKDKRERLMKQAAEAKEWREWYERQEA